MTLVQENSDVLLTWEQWVIDHPELQRTNHSTLVFDNKILYIGGRYEQKGLGLAFATTPQALNIALIDHQKQTIKVIPPSADSADIKSYSFEKSPVCYWKDSALVICGERTSGIIKNQLVIAIVTLKDLDSESPSANWQIVKDLSKTKKTQVYATHIYDDKLFLIRELPNRKTDEICCFNLNTSKWILCECTGIDFKETEATRGYPVYYKNKIFMVSSIKIQKTISEFDLDTMTCKILTGPGQMDAKLYIICNQLIDGKIYLLLSNQYNGCSAQVWTYHIADQKWTKIETENPPKFSFAPRLLYLENQLVLCGGSENNMLGHPEFLSLPFAPSQSVNPKRLWTAPQNLTPMQQSLRKFLMEGVHSDVSFEVGNYTIRAHKCWLAHKSKYFTDMFAINNNAKIVITEMSSSTFQILLEYTYYDHAELTYIIAIELLQKAEKISMPELQKLCEAFLEKNLERDNYLEVIKIAEKLRLASLRQAVVNYIAKNIKTLKQFKSFEEMPDSLLREVIVKFIVKN